MFVFDSITGCFYDSSNGLLVLSILLLMFITLAYLLRGDRNRHCIDIKNSVQQAKSTTNISRDAFIPSVDDLIDSNQGIINKSSGDIQPITTMDELAAANTARQCINKPHATLGTNSVKKPKQQRTTISIDKQRQSYLPMYKSRCEFWPRCTNKRCRYYHPFTECRNGNQCQFGNKCIFLHPKDYRQKDRTKASYRKQAQKTSRPDTT
ncbi:hypothetical protein BC941DRAFT_439337 [Chlamydoabsidia padenii]|nr:hypothetical protein BC941DRAFT_439337 [Chlamydoabsidia padenii]